MLRVWYCVGLGFKRTPLDFIKSLIDLTWACWRHAMTLLSAFSTYFGKPHYRNVLYKQAKQAGWLCSFLPSLLSQNYTLSYMEIRKVKTSGVFHQVTSSAWVSLHPLRQRLFLWSSQELVHGEKTVSQNKQGISWIENMMHVHTQELSWVFPQLRFLVYDAFLQKTLRKRQIEGGRKGNPQPWSGEDEESLSVSAVTGRREWKAQGKQGGEGKWAA